MARKDTDYEKYVRDIMEALLHAQGLETVVVAHDKQVQGLSRSHQIDVYWEYRLGGVLHRIIINCKRYADTVEVTDVETLGGVLHDLPGVRGMIVSTVGYQKGAIEYATTHQIGLKVIRPPEDGDWKGRIRAIKLSIAVRTPKLLDCKFLLNTEWNKANVPDDGTPPSTVKLSSSQVFVRDASTGGVEDMTALFSRAVRENPTESDEGAGVLRWEDARFERPGAHPLRIDGIEFRWRYVGGDEPLVRTIRSDPAAIVRDAIAGTLLFVDPEGRVTGDVEEELGTKPR